MFTCLYVPSRSSFPPRSRLEHPSAARSVTDTLVRLAREFSPRVEVQGEHLVMLDTSGLGNMVGDARAVGDALRRAAADRGLCARVAVATTRMAALLAVQGRAGLTVIPPGLEAASLASLPLGVLKALAEIQASGARKAGQARGQALFPTCPTGSTRPTRPPLALPAFALLSTVRRWGLKTLGDLAALPSADLFERLGAGGLMLQRLARGEDDRPLVPDPVENPLEASLALEWPIEGLEPFSFVLRRLFETLCARLERGRVGAAVLHVRLWLVTREVHARTLQLPAPLRDPRVLCTLVLLDLEAHPPSAGIDRVAIVVDPAPTRMLQFSLLERALPSPEQISTLLARLAALMGEGRCGAPALVDSHKPEAFEMRPFNPGAGSWGPNPKSQIPNPELQGPLISVLRRFRVPVTARVTVDRGRPVRVATGHRSVDGGRVVMCAGPWRTSGHWWTGRARGTRRASVESRIPNPESREGTNEQSSSSSPCWDRDEWDVALTDGGVYRIYRDRGQRSWFVEGVID